MRIASLILGGLMLAGGATAQDLDAGRQVAGMCRTCHGLDGYARIPIAPHIGGEDVAYLDAQLRAFRSGARVNEMMTVVAGSLGDQQIADVAAWYGAHKAVATVPEGAAPPPEQCVACHGADGIAVIEGVPNLAAETNIYIDTQLKAFRLGKRENETMQAMSADLTDAEIRALADWFAAIKLEISAPE